VLDVKGNGRTKVSTALRDAQQRVAGHLESVGASVQERSFERLRSSFDIWSASFGSAQGKNSFKRDLQRTTPELAWHMILWALGRSPHTLPAILLGLVENVGSWTPKRTARFVEAGRELRTEIIEAIGPDGVMLYPSYPTTAPRHNTPINLRFEYVFMGILNILELPVTQVPLGLDEEGLPLGVQVASVPGNDHVTIAVALELERAFGGWVPPWEAGR
jgi:fatty acid amide hydrolase 2